MGVRSAGASLRLRDKDWGTVEDGGGMLVKSALTFTLALALVEECGSGGCRTAIFGTTAEGEGFDG